MMLVAFWRTLVKIVVVFQHKRQRNKSFSRFLDNLETPTRTVQRAALQYANELSLLVRVRLPFKNSFAKYPNEQKQQETIKTGFGYD